MVAIMAAMIGAAKRIMPPAMSCGRIDLMIAISSGRVIVWPPKELEAKLNKISSQINAARISKRLFCGICALCGLIIKFKGVYAANV